MTKKEPKKIEVLETSLEAMADNIAALSEVGKMIKKSGLKERAILVLLKDLTGISKSQIKTVLDALPKLEKNYLK